MLREFVAAVRTRSGALAHRPVKRWIGDWEVSFDLSRRGWAHRARVPPLCLHCRFRSEPSFVGVRRGARKVGQDYAALPDAARRAACEEARHDLGNTGRPIEIEAEIMFDSGLR